MNRKLQHFNASDLTRDAFMLKGKLYTEGYDWWWHNFTGVDAETGEEKPFFIEFFTINPGLAEEKPVFGQLPESKAAGKKPSYLMVKAGCWGDGKCQLHRFFSWKDVEMKGDAPFSVNADDCICSERELSGHVSISSEDAAAHPEWMCDAGEMSWNLTVNKKVTFNVGLGASKALRDVNAFQMYWHAEGMKTAFGGEVMLNGRRYIVTPERCYGYSDKNWGSNFTSPWVWLSSNHLVSRLTGKKLDNSVFDIGGGRPKIFMVPLDRRLLGVMYYEGQEFDYNFSKVLLRVKTKFSFRETDEEVFWHVTQENVDSVMDTRIRCKKKDMLFVNYESPDGMKRYSRLWNGGNGVGQIKLYRKTADGLQMIDDMIATHVGCEYGEYDEE